MCLKFQPYEEASPEQAVLDSMYSLFQSKSMAWLSRDQFPLFIFNNIFYLQNKKPRTISGYNYSGLLHKPGSEPFCFSYCLLARDCSTLYSSGVRTSGVYTINPDGQSTFPVFCDMHTDGGGWTVIQRRLDGATNFFRDWDAYKRGFGDLAREFWLGNDKISRFTKAIPTDLLVEVSDWEGTTVIAKYGIFRVASESLKYELTVGSYSGDAGDSLSYHNGSSFTTMDRDNDNKIGENCAIKNVGAWWYNSCHDSNLNGQYMSAGKTDSKGIVWYYWKKSLEVLKTSQIMLKPKSSG